jgi:peptidyl-prolyl cis-trans isomerase B (cyclophilin B)
MNFRTISACVFTLAILLLSTATQAQKKPNLKKNDYLITITTVYGDVEIRLYDETPLHKQNFVKLAQQGFFDSCTFHRVLDGFVIQGGDPYSKPSGGGQVGTGGPGYTIPAEIVPEFKHRRGALAAARQGDAVNPKRESSGSQFYIVLPKQGTPHLDQQYSIFGEVVRGMEVADKIAQQKVDRQGKPSEDIFMKVKCELIPRKSLEARYGFKYPVPEKKKKKKKEAATATQK